MDITLIMGVFLILALLAIIGNKIENKETFEYEKRFLLTKAETKFYHYLIQAIDEKNHIIFPKVRIADIVKPKKGLSKKQYNQNFWRTSSKHIDFLLVDKKTFLPVVCIELNDSSHNRADRKKRDVLVEKVMKSTEIPIVWVQAKRNYQVDEIKKSIYASNN
ncbi:MAG: Topoisomerase [uncultured Sulfurovum sp.]|uniref:Topoisomerase n=1 Tax=uncultured Sulfurovum sp. TaxID=269237 RepID=A0A6S6SPM5_9BACT|nr:MAG: Topoisomerase [uncultured Sulfurovum sp.]